MLHHPIQVLRARTRREGTGTSVSTQAGDSCRRRAILFYRGKIRGPTLG
jgi:hypothetical protein